MPWDEFDDTSAEAEMGALLYGLVRMLKPALVVETGCYVGHTTVQLAKAVMNNQHGQLVSCDIHERFTDAARANLEKAECDPEHYRIERCSSLDLPELAAADFIFSDSDYHVREREIARAKKGAVIVVHDTTFASWQRYGRGYRHLGEIVKAHGGMLFEVSRGFGLIQKR